MTEKTTAKSWRDFEAAWNEFVLSYGRALKMDRFVDWLEKQLRRVNNA